MTTLHLGVIDIPYTDAGASVTTGDVAGFLERKYGVMDGFMYLHGPEVADHLADSVAGAIESLLAGAPPTIDPFGSAMSRIESDFRDYLTKEETSYIGSAGIPTAAALRGESKRFKRKKGPPRPSFIDSGTYQATFKAWMSDE